MKFSAAGFFVLAASLTASVSAQWDNSHCNELSLETIPDYASALLDACEDDVMHAGTNDFYSHISCVAAATVLTPGRVADALGCNTDTGLDFTKDKVDHLKFEIYADIVGECAYDQPACSIGQQEYIDFLYRALDEACTDEWPSSEEAVEWWTTISEWTMTGEVSPYVNFDDFLHYY